MTPRTFTAVPWRWEASTGPNGWVFASLPEDLSDAIAETGRAAGFGSVRVEVTIGATTWSTSVFPDHKRRTYVLPLKRAVRRAERLEAGTTAVVELVLAD